MEQIDDPASWLTVEQLRLKYHLPERYAFYPANMWPHKNHRLLLLALHRLRQTYGMSLSLVLTGDDMGEGENLRLLPGIFTCMRTYTIWDMCLLTACQGCTGRRHAPLSLTV